MLFAMLRIVKKTIPSYKKVINFVPGVGYVNRTISNVRVTTNAKIKTARETAFRSGLLLTIIGIIIWLAIFMYVTFYYTYIPSLSHNRQVHLQFEPCDDTKNVVCSFPRAHIQLTNKQSFLMVGQSYKIYMHLDVPESEANKQLGMFMTCLQLTDKDGVIMGNSCRSAILHYRSWLLYAIRTCFLSPLFVFGSFEEKQRLTVEMYSNFEEDQSRPVTDAYIEIQSRRIEVYTATIQIHAHFTGLRYLMFHWPMLSAIVGISLNLFFILLTAALSWYHLNFFEDKALVYNKIIKEKFASFNEDVSFSGQIEDEETSLEDSSFADVPTSTDGENVDVVSGSLKMKRTQSASSTEC